MSDAFDAEVWRLVLTDATFARLAAVMVRAPVCLPTVVAAELSRMARSDEAFGHVDGLCERLRGTTEAPSVSDWAEAGKVCRAIRAGRKLSAEEEARLETDALMAAMCARLQWSFVTTRRRELSRLALAFGGRAPRFVFLTPP